MNKRRFHAENNNRLRLAKPPVAERADHDRRFCQSTSAVWEGASVVRRLYGKGPLACAAVAGLAGPGDGWFGRAQARRQQ